MVKKILASILCGIIILLATWKYQNYDYTHSIEDKFFKKIFFLKDKVHFFKPRKKEDFVFINTGKDLALVEDSVDYGNIAISDREKIYRFIKHINTLKKKPAYTVLDIQFYYPYTPDPQVDSLLSKELAKNDRLLIPILKDGNGKYIDPLYTSNYGYSDYRTFGSSFNKFRIMNKEAVSSIPIILDEQLNKSSYEDDFIYPTCNNRLCLSAIWPSYYVKNSDLGKIQQGSALQDIQKAEIKNTNENGISAQYFNIGEMLFDLDANPGTYSNAFENKIVIIGNFQEDQHSTPVGKMAGPVLLANIYLSLLNGEHIVNPWFLLILLVAFSGLSYVALYKKMPEINLNFKFLFSSYLVKFIKGFISYFGAMFCLSLLAVFLFNVQVALILPSLIFIGIEYIKEGKFKNIFKSVPAESKQIERAV